MADTKMGATPSRKTSDEQLNQWNIQLRQHPAYMEFLASIGINPGGPIKLSEQQQNAFERFLAAKGIQIPEGMHIDPAGNLNQKNTLWKNVAKGAAIGGAAVTGLGAAGIGPLAGAFGTAGASTAGAAGATGSGAAGAAGAPTFFGVGGGAGLGGALSGVPASLAPGAGIVGGAAGAPTFFGAGSGAGAGTAAGGTGLLSTIAKNAKSPSTWSDAGRAIGAAGDTAAQNRGVGLDADMATEALNLRARQQYMDELLARQREGRESGTDAWKKLQQSEYAIGKTSDYTPPSVKIMGQDRQLADFGFGPKASTPGEITGAEAMKAEAMKRLTGGNPIPEPTAPTPYEFEGRHPGTFEKIANVAAPAATIWGTFSRFLR